MAFKGQRPEGLPVSTHRQFSPHRHQQPLVLHVEACDRVTESDLPRSFVALLLSRHQQLESGWWKCKEQTVLALLCPLLFQRGVFLSLTGINMQLRLQGHFSLESSFCKVKYSDPPGKHKNKVAAGQLLGTATLCNKVGHTTHPFTTSQAISKVNSMPRAWLRDTEEPNDLRKGN